MNFKQKEYGRDYSQASFPPKIIALHRSVRAVKIADWRNRDSRYRQRVNNSNFCGGEQTSVELLNVGIRLVL